MSQLNADTCRSVVECLIEKMNARYIFPETAAAFEAAVREKMAAGAYQHMEDIYALARQLTDELQAATKDRHLRVEYDPSLYERLVAQEQKPDTDEDDDDEESYARYYRDGIHRNFGFERIERLKGNIGYILLNEFFYAKYGGETAIAAMNFVANTRALIFDLRRNGGGSPSMIQLLTSYLFDSPKHLNSFYTRHKDTYEQFWTHAHVPGKRLAKIPAYVLTSSRTFSAAEEFTYNLKHMKRATIIGETTGGGAHPITPMSLTDGLVVALCEARAVNPITSTNWEGTGVEPDIPIPADEALMKAHVLALETLCASSTASDEQALLEWDAATVRTLYQPPQIPAEILNRYTGAFKQYTFFIREGKLAYTARGFTGTLHPVEDTLFADAGNEGLRFQFVAAGKDTPAGELRLLRRSEPDVIVILRSPD